MVCNVLPRKDKPRCCAQSYRCHVLRHHQILITLNDDHRIQPLRWPSSEGYQREQWDHHPGGQLANDVALHIQQIGVSAGIALVAVDRLT
jgi:hypothetical protein